MTLSVYSNCFLSIQKSRLKWFLSGDKPENDLRSLIWLSRALASFRICCFFWSCYCLAPCYLSYIIVFEACSMLSNPTLLPSNCPMAILSPWSAKSWRFIFSSLRVAPILPALGRSTWSVEPNCVLNLFLTEPLFPMLLPVKLPFGKQVLFTGLSVYTLFFYFFTTSFTCLI